MGYVLAGSGKGAVIENRAAFGNAWWAAELRSVSSARAEMNATCAEDLGTVAVVNTNQFTLSSTNLGTEGDIKLVNYSPNKLVYESSNRKAGLAVFSEIYYPEWTAKIDGKEVPVLRANYVLRALEVPEGNHTIEFEIKLKSYENGNLISQIFGWSLMGLLVFGLFKSLKKED
jgi:uncharacterized membrane protein YfhO